MSVVIIVYDIALFIYLSFAGECAEAIHKYFVYSELHDDRVWTEKGRFCWNT